MTLLLFTRKKFQDAILRGEKTFEVRRGNRYAGVKRGDQLSINGRFRVTVTDVRCLESKEQVCRAAPVQLHDLDVVYPGDAGPFFLFLFGMSGQA